MCTGVRHHPQSLRMNEKDDDDDDDMATNHQQRSTAESQDECTAQNTKREAGGILFVACRGHTHGYL